METINIALEFHDSTWARAERSGSDLVITLSPVFVHASSGEPGVDPGSGYWQNARIVLRETRDVSIPIELPAHLDDGTLAIESERYKNVVPLPMNAKARCILSLVIEDGSRYELQAAGVVIELFGAPRGVENFSGVQPKPQ